MKKGRLGLTETPLLILFFITYSTVTDFAKFLG